MNNNNPNNGMPENTNNTNPENLNPGNEGINNVPNNLNDALNANTIPETKKEEEINPTETIVESTPNIEQPFTQNPVVEETVFVEPTTPEVESSEEIIMTEAGPMTAAEAEAFNNAKAMENKVEEVAPIVETAPVMEEVKSTPVVETVSEVIPEMTNTIDQPVMNQEVKNNELNSIEINENTNPEDLESINSQPSEIETDPALEITTPNLEENSFDSTIASSEPIIFGENLEMDSSKEMVNEEKEANKMILDDTPSVEPIMDNSDALIIDDHKKKGGKTGLIVFLIILIALIGAGAYLYTTGMLDPIINKITNKDNKEESTAPKEPTDNENKDNVSLKENSKEIKELSVISINHYLTNQNEESVKVFYSNEAFEIAQLENKYKLDLVISYLESTKAFEKKNINGFEMNFYSQELINKTVTKLFGNNIDYKEPLSLCIYNEELLGYTCSSSFEGIKYADKVFDSAKKTTVDGVTKIEIIETVAFLKNDMEADTTTYYKDVALTEEIGKASYNNKEYLKANQDKFSKYKHTFILNADNNYIYTSIELVK